MQTTDAEWQTALTDMASLFGTLSGTISDLMLSRMRDQDPEKFLMLHRLLNAGFSPALLMQILGKAPANETQCIQWAMTVIAHNLRLPSSDIIKSGGIYALVGPTGVGKTTTTAKLAAHGVLQHGSRSVAVLTMDNYRLGAYEQLRLFAKILDIPVYCAKTPDELHILLKELSHKHLILIDTPGMGQLDSRVARQARILNEFRISNLLLLNAGTAANALHESIRAYRDAYTIGCILTKIDEAHGLGAVLDITIRHKLTVHFITNGQRVPEDLHLPHKASLLRQALMPHTMRGAFALHDTECHAAMTAFM